MNVIANHNGRSHLKQAVKNNTIRNNKDSLDLFHRHHTGTNDTKERSRLIFPERLFRMLDDIDQKQAHLSHIITWHPIDLNSFVIHKPVDFAREVMPVYFPAQTKVSSFQRQLKNYGFQLYQQRKKNGRMIYCHPHFCRGKPSSLQNVVLKSKTTVHKALTISSLIQIDTLLQMSAKKPQEIPSSTTSCLPQDPAPENFHTSGTTITFPLPSENVRDEILDEAPAAELLWRQEEACDEKLCFDILNEATLELACDDSYCFDVDFDCQQQYDDLSRLVAQCDPAVESFESIEDELLSFYQATFESGRLYTPSKVI